MINWRKIFELILCLKKIYKRWKRIEGKERKQKDILCFHHNNFLSFFFIFSGPNTIALDASLGPDEVLSAALEACEVMMTIFFFFFCYNSLSYLYFLFFFSLHPSYHLPHWRITILLTFYPSLTIVHLNHYSIVHLSHYSIVHLNHYSRSLDCIPLLRLLALRVATGWA